MRILTFSLIVAATLAGPLARGDEPKKSCADPVPKECAKVKLLGEEKDCACFVCNPGTKSRKVVCTSDEETKKALYKLRDETEQGEKPAKPAAEGSR